MSAILISYPKAHVVRWNSSNVYVRCLYCEKIHQHGVQLPGRRTSNCYPGGEYEFIFPIDEKRELVGYEIDKGRAYFVNASLKTDQENEILHSSGDDECELTDAFRSQMNLSTTKPKSEPVLNLYDDSREFETISLPNGNNFKQKRILSPISDCILGNLSAINQYLRTSGETKLFLHGRDSTGDTILIKAASEKSHEMVSLLLNHGADANAINNAGRSALMQAALWGRIENVRALLNANADKGLRDREGRCAIDLAQQTRKNEKERYWRSPYESAQRMLESDRDRRHIIILLEDLNAETLHEYTGPMSESESNEYSFRKSECKTTITLYGPNRNYYVPNIKKTVAFLDRESTSLVKRQVVVGVPMPYLWKIKLGHAGSIKSIISHPQLAISSHVRQIQIGIMADPGSISLAMRRRS